MSELVKANSLVTLHYRIATADDVELISTFDAQPATLQLGSGELAPTLEACIEAMPVGERHTHLLPPQQAFGERREEMQQRMPLSSLPNGGEGLSPMMMVEFEAPPQFGGGKFTGVVRDIDADAALIDFNHPLAGKSIRFEVEVIGIL